MVSSLLSGNDTRNVTVNATANDTAASQARGSGNFTLTASSAVLRGYKRIVNNPEYPANITVEIEVQALGGAVNEIAFADYLPDSIDELSDLQGLNITYINRSTGSDTHKTLTRNLDFNVSDPPKTDRLPDGYLASVFLYNLTFNYTNWNGMLFENDSIHLNYTVTVLGGGNWTLPLIIGAFDPQYMKHIRTEMYTEANVPSFDVITKVLTRKLKQGDDVKAALTMINVGGPKAKVDVFVTYSAKTMDGELITERSETLAVVEKIEKELVLPLPSTIEPGMYTFEAFVTYTKREAVSTDVFEVLGEKTAAAGFSQYIMFAIFGVAMILLAIFVFVRTRKK